MGSRKTLATNDIKAIRSRLEATTPGPWRSFLEGRDHQSGSDFIQTGGEDIELSGASREDQEFIAHAHQDIARLLDEIDHLNLLLDDQTGPQSDL